MVPVGGYGSESIARRCDGGLSGIAPGDEGATAPDRHAEPVTGSDGDKASPRRRTRYLPVRVVAPGNEAAIAPDRRTKPAMSSNCDKASARRRTRYLPVRVVAPGN